MFNNGTDTTIQDCLDNIKSRFQLSLVATYRARQISQGHAIKIDPKKIEKKRKNTSIALAEIAHGLVGIELLKKVPDGNN
ncbi:MAG: hypothetical protein RLZZ210_749 [Pseudomonadota bacterium]|jgi:DNA-directed RNA polymerase subunit omega